MAEGGAAAAAGPPRGADRDSPMDDLDEAAPPRFQRQISHQDIGEQAAVLLRNFIVDRFERDGIPNPPQREDFGPTASPEGEEVWAKVGCTLREIADMLDQDLELQSMINSVPTDSPIDAIMEVAQVIFGDGEIHWGRIIGLFYFAYRLCVRAMDNILSRNFPGWLNQLIREIVRFLVRRFADWIIRRGGWTSITEYMGTSTAAWGAVVVGSIATLAFSLYKLNR